MTADEYAHLMDFLAQRFARVDDRFDARTDERDRQLAQVAGGVRRLEIKFDRFSVDFGTVHLDHGARIEVLERRRKP